MSVIFKPPYPTWTEKSGKVFTVCSTCHRLLEGTPPILCLECGEAARARKREQRNARKAAKAVAG
jgi:rRNA maturation endonuclease Nob1